MPESDEEKRSAILIRTLIGIGAGLLVLVVGSMAATGLKQYPVPPNWEVPGGSPSRGRTAIRRYACAGCHTIPGVPGAEARVGPQLAGLRKQGYVAGKLANVPLNLVSWIRDPQKSDPGTAMPNLGVTEGDARDIAAYLYSLE